MGEAINVNSFHVNFPFQFHIAKMHSQTSFSRFFCKLSVPILNETSEETMSKDLTVFTSRYYYISFKVF